MAMGALSRTAQRPCGLYLISNSALGNQKQAGVAYRHTKSYTDKVWGESPALWGDIVEGVDDGRGWLQVGDYYLPMAFDGIPIITPILGFCLPPSQPAPRGECESEWWASLDRAAASDSTTSPQAVSRRRQPPVDDHLYEEVCAKKAEPSSTRLGLRPPSAELHIRMERDLPIVNESAEEGEDTWEASSSSWSLRPSVGTWLLLQPRPAGSAEASPPLGAAAPPTAAASTAATAASPAAAQQAGEEEEEEVTTAVEEAWVCPEQPSLRRDVKVKELAADLGPPTLALDLLLGGCKSLPITPSTVAPDERSPACSVATLDSA